MSSSLAPGTISIGWNRLNEMFVDLFGKIGFVGGISVNTGTEKERVLDSGDNDVKTGVEKDNALGEGGILMEGMISLESFIGESSLCFFSTNFAIRLKFLNSL